MHAWALGQRRLDTLTDPHGTPCHVWLVNIAEEIGHAYGPARNSVSRMVSQDQRGDGSRSAFCTCPVARTRSCRSTILGSRIVEMGLYCFYVSVALGCHNFAARAS